MTKKYTSEWYNEMALAIRREVRQAEEITIAHARVVGYKSDRIQSLIWKHQPIWKKILCTTVLLPFVGLFGISLHRSLRQRKEKEKLKQEIEAQQ